MRTHLKHKGSAIFAGRVVPRGPDNAPIAVLCQGKAGAKVGELVRHNLQARRERSKTERASEGGSMEYRRRKKIAIADFATHTHRPWQPNTASITTEPSMTR